MIQTVLSRKLLELWLVFARVVLAYDTALIPMHLSRIVAIGTHTDSTLPVRMWCVSEKRVICIHHTVLVHAN